MRTKFCDQAEEFGEKKNSRKPKFNGATLKSESYNDRKKSGNFAEDLEYKNCLLDLTVTDM